jgi:hypothetical protein
MVNGQKGTIADLKPGMTVSVTIGVDPTQASRVVATGAPGGRVFASRLNDLTNHDPLSAKTREPIPESES